MKDYYNAKYFNNYQKKIGEFGGLANKFQVLKTGIIYHKWPPFWLKIQQIFVWKIFHFIAKIYGRLNLCWTQSFIVAQK